jgi:ABC-2 type transport system permease protein
MNSASSTIPGSDTQTQATASAISARQTFYWCVRREIWENRWIYIAPSLVAAVVLVGHFISTVYLPSTMRAAMTLDPMKQHEAIVQHYDILALFIMGATFLVGIFYSLDALSGERRDRSILFWKSMPVSDAMTVLSKAFIPIVLLPALTFVVTVVTQLLMLLWSSAVLAANGLSVATLWTHVSPIRMWTELFIHLMAGHSLYYAPVFAWLLLVSAWARRAAFLWATLPLFAIAGLEKIAFNTAYFANMLGNRIAGGSGNDSAQGSSAMHSALHIDLARFIVSPGLWIGLAFAEGFLALAVRLRRMRGPN